jgi:hypothetical protein
MKTETIPTNKDLTKAFDVLQDALNAESIQSEY